MKILAVDDDDIILEILSEAVQAIGGHEIELAGSALEALDVIKAAETPFDCFLLDIQMPQMTGIELCEEIRANSEYLDTPILMITAMSDKGYVDRAFGAGATDYVTKPFDVLELNTRISIAERMMFQMHPPAPSSSSLDSIVDQLVGEKAYVLTEAIPLMDVGGALNLHSFENYLKQLKRGQYYSSAIFAIGVRNVDAIHALSSGREFGDHITDVAEAISECVRSIPGFFTYVGSGLFCCVIEGKHNAVIADLLYALENATAHLDLVYRNGNPVDVGYTVGDPVTPSIFVRADITEILQKSIQRLDTGAVEKFSVNAKFNRA